MCCAVANRTVAIQIIERIATVIDQCGTNAIEIEAEILNTFDQCVFVDYQDRWIGGRNCISIRSNLSQVKLSHRGVVGSGNDERG